MSAARRAAGAAAVLVALAFLLVPIAALFASVGIVPLVRSAGNGVFVGALLVSLKTSAIAHACVLLVGTAAGYVLGRARFPGRRALLAVIDLPLVLPPAVAGIALLAVFGARGLLGGTLDAAGLRIPYTQVAVVLAVAFVELPIFLKQAAVAFEGVDERLLEAARTLGDGPGRVFRRVALPLAAPGLAAGSSLAWARGLGEFGATLMFAGSLQGVTQTLPLAIYAELNVDYSVALAIGALLVLVSVAVLLVVRLTPTWTRFALVSPIGFATSRSS